MSHDDTILVLTGIGIPDFSARGLTETIEMIEGVGELRRTVNGASIDVTAVQFQKFKVRIETTDQEPPAFNGVWIGKQVTVDLVSRWSYLTSGGSPDRTIVPGSSVVNGLFTSYRPQLICRVALFSQRTEEWAANRGWSLDLVEE